MDDSLREESPFVFSTVKKYEKSSASPVFKTKLV